jgi:hypothetical protein
LYCQMWVPLCTISCELPMRVIPSSHKSCKCFSMEHVTLRELACGIVKNKINYLTIMKSMASWIALHFICMSYNNPSTLQSKATMVKLKCLRW